MKKCKNCQNVLPLESYHKDSALLDGHRNICKKCAVERAGRSSREKYDATNGLSSVLKSMKARCYSSTHRSFPRYGGRGISICQEWLEDENVFYQWALGNGYRKGLQIDRINNDGHYDPENCRFVTPAQNQHNTSKNLLIDEDIRCIRSLYKSGRKKQQEIAQFFGVNQSTISVICSEKTWKEESLCLSR